MTVRCRCRAHRSRSRACRSFFWSPCRRARSATRRRPGLMLPDPLVGRGPSRHDGLALARRRLGHRSVPATHHPRREVRRARRARHAGLHQRQPGGRRRGDRVRQRPALVTGLAEFLRRRIAQPRDRSPRPRPLHQRRRAVAGPCRRADAYTRRSGASSALSRSLRGIADGPGHAVATVHLLDRSHVLRRRSRSRRCRRSSGYGRGSVLFGSTGYPFWTAQRSRTCASLTPYFLAMTLNGASACSPSAFIWSVFALSCPSAVLQVESGTRLL